LLVSLDNAVLFSRGPDALRPSGSAFADRKIRLSPKHLRGDLLVEQVLDCLAKIACLYGEQVILVQYWPYCWDLLNLCKKKLSPNLEGGILGVLSLSRRVVTYLTDAVLMNELPDNLMSAICLPVLQLVTSRTLIFSGGWRMRQTAAFR